MNWPSLTNSRLSFFRGSSLPVLACTLSLEVGLVPLLPTPVVTASLDRTAEAAPVRLAPMISSSAVSASPASAAVEGVVDVASLALVFRRFVSLLSVPSKSGCVILFLSTAPATNEFTPITQHPLSTGLRVRVPLSIRPSPHGNRSDLTLKTSSLFATNLPRLRTTRIISRMSPRLRATTVRAVVATLCYRRPPQSFLL